MVEGQPRCYERGGMPDWGAEGREDVGPGADEGCFHQGRAVRTDPLCDPLTYFAWNLDRP
jgi:hypothetical protein